MSMTTHSRREFLRDAALAGATLAVGAPVLAGCGDGAATPAAGDSKLTFGGLTALTGAGAGSGIPMREGTMVALDKLKAEGHRLAAVFQDHKGEPNAGVGGYRKLVDERNVPAIILGFSSVISATTPLADRHKVLLLNPSGTGANLEGLGEYLLNTEALGSLHARAMAKYAFEQGKRRAGLLIVNNDSGTPQADNFIEVFQGAGGQIVVHEKFEPNQIDFGSQIAKIKPRNPDVMLVIGVVQETFYGIRRCVEAGIDAQYIANQGVEQEEAYEIAGKALEGVWYPAPVFDPTSNEPAVAEFIKRYKAKYDKDPIVLAAQWYQAVHILAEAAQAAPDLTGEALRAKILEIKTFDGVTGKTVFQENGTVLKPLHVKQIGSGFSKNVLTELPPEYV
ncbi:MAG: ABC transporter substrate-binding protein [Micromonosporaceae bacterium]|nr:ABC transporter substrate-binding protein [Micromonosporaceae bacterium]